MRMSRYSRRGRARQSGEKEQLLAELFRPDERAGAGHHTRLFYILYQYFLMYDDYEARRDQMVVLQASLEQSEADIAASSRPHRRPD